MSAIIQVGTNVTHGNLRQDENAVTECRDDAVMIVSEAAIRNDTVTVSEDVRRCNSHCRHSSLKEQRLA